MTEWFPMIAPSEILTDPEVHDNVTLPSGMVRGREEGKVDYLLVRDGPMYERWARHLSYHAGNKGVRNWMNANTEEDLERFRRSAARHFEQWLRGDDDEDHAAALIFNLNGAEEVLSRLEARPSESRLRLLAEANGSPPQGTG